MTAATLGHERLRVQRDGVWAAALENQCAKQMSWTLSPSALKSSGLSPTLCKFGLGKAVAKQAQCYLRLCSFLF